jgi:cytochrome P450
MFPYGEVWRRHRKLCWQHFNPEAAKRYNPMQTEQVYKLMNNIINDPERVFEHVSL